MQYFEASLDTTSEEMQPYTLAELVNKLLNTQFDFETLACLQ
jgi:hypothetical protein